MRDIELYRHLLGLEAPWKIAEVKLDIPGQRVDVRVEHGEGLSWPCPDCQTRLGIYDHSEERTWRHLDSCQFMTYLRARPPRVQCPTHGVKQVRLPWAEPMSRFTALFERLAIDVLKETTVKGARTLLRLSWDEVWHIMERAVERGLLAKENRVPEVLGVDEKAIAKGHQYFTVACDLVRQTVEYVAEERTKDSLAGYFEPLTPGQREGLWAVAMDMWEPYVQVVRQYVPEADAKIVFDRFHVMGHAGDAVDKVRRREHRELKEEGDETLKGSRYLWLYAKENLPAKDRRRFADLKAQHLKTGRAWAIKESLRNLWKYVRRGWAERFWKRWYAWAVRSRLQPIEKLAQMLKRHRPQILNYIDMRITNGPLEAINRKIETIKRKACGFRNRDHFRIAIFFHCGGLQLYPATHGKP